MYLEKYDDIIVEQNNKISIIEQVKDVGSNITNNSLDFWKTISNWIKLKLEYPDKFTAYTRYVLSVNSHKNIKDNFTFILRADINATIAINGALTAILVII